MKKLPDTVLFVSKVTAWIGSVSSLIVHTGFFIAVFVLGLTHIASWTLLLLVLTTVVSLEAIYLAILIQFTVNQNSESLREVEEDIDEIQEDVEELGEDVGEISEDIEEITEDIDEIQENVDEIQEDVEELSDDATVAPAPGPKKTVDELANDLRRILADLESMKGGK